MKRPMANWWVLIPFLLMVAPVLGIWTGGVSPKEEDIKELVDLSHGVYDIDLPSSYCFIENDGQWDPEIRFVTETSFGRAAITDDGIIYDIQRVSHHEEDRSEPLFPGFEPKTDLEIERDVIKVSFEGSIEPDIKGSGPLPQRYNYFIGNDPDKWVSGAVAYEKVMMQDIYDGIDARYYFNGGDLKYDLILDPYTDPDQIILKVEGADHLEVDDMSVSFVRSNGPLLHDSSLKVFHTDDESTIEANFRLLNDHSYGFDLEEYDNSKKIVIDPVIRSAFHGGNDRDTIYGIDSTLDGRYIVTGYTGSTDFPTTPGSYQEEYPNKTGYDYHISMIMGFGKDMDSLQFATYFGGNGTDYGTEIRLDDDGSIFVSGSTTSPDFPLTSGVYDNETNGGSDCYLSKFASSGSSLEFSTLLGGNHNDRPYSMELGPGGWIYLIGTTRSDDFPQTALYKNLSYPATYQAFFICQIDDQGKILRRSLVFNSTLWIGANDLLILENGNLLISANAGAYDIQTTSGCLNITGNTTNRWNTAIFIMEVDLENHSVEKCARIAGDGRELGYSISMDDEGDIWVGGVTNSPDFPLTEDCFQSGPCNEYDLCIFELDGNLTELKYSTYISGDGDEHSITIDIDPKTNRIYAAGKSYSGNLYTTDDAFQKRSAGSSNGYLYVFNTTDHSLVHSTYLTSSGGEFLWDMISVGNYTIAAGGCSFGGEFPQGSSHIENRTDEFYYSILFEYQLPIPPEPPINLSIDHFASEDNWHVNLSWSPPDDPGNGELIEYEVYYKEYLTETGSILNGYDGTTINNWYQFEFSTPVYAWSFAVKMITTSGTSNLSEIASVSDDILPIFGEDLSYTNFTEDGYVYFAINVTDNYRVNNVILSYFLDDGILYNSSLTRSQNDHYIGSLFLLIKNGDVHYRFTAMDRGGNTNSTENRTIKAIDVIPPELREDLTPAQVEVGNVIHFKVNVTDNVRVTGVDLEVVFFNTTLKLNMTNDEGENWTYDYLPPGNITSLNYIITIFDGYNNSILVTGIISLQDNFPPEFIEDLSDQNIVLYNKFNVGAVFQDPSGVQIARVEYRLSTESANLIQDMTLVDEVYRYSIYLPWWDQDPMDWDPDMSLTYRFMAWDLHDRRTTTNWTTVFIGERSDIGPLTFHHLSFCTTGDVFRFSVWIAPNNTYERVIIHVWTNSSSIDEAEQMWMDPDNPYDLLTDMVVPIDSIETIWYEIIVQTGSNENITYGPFSLQVLDNKPPTIAQITNTRIRVGTNLKVSTEINDNIGVSDIIWEMNGYTYSGDELNWYAERVGNYWVTVTAYDGAGNSGIRHFNIEVYDTDSHQDPNQVEGEKTDYSLCIVPGIIIMILIIVIARAIMKEKMNGTPGKQSIPSLRVGPEKIPNPDDELMIPFKMDEGTGIRIDVEDEGPPPWKDEKDDIEDEEDLEIEEDGEELKIKVTGEEVMKIRSPAEGDPGPRLAPPPPMEE